MPWCGWWGTPTELWWLMPLIGLLFMGAMFFVCIRGFGRMTSSRRGPGELVDLRREVQSLKEDVRKLLQQAR